MFTGIVEEIGRIESITRQGESATLEIAGSLVFEDLHVGDSIAVNGVCLTVTSFRDKVFSADVMHETLDRSSLGRLRVGSAVNLERAMPANARFGGHIVSGHIDGTGVVIEVRPDSNARWYRIEAAPHLMRYIVEKGSIAIDGVSLTVARVDDTTFSVSIIPHTAEQTTLALRRAGDVVNLENDVIGKYVERLLTFETVPETLPGPQGAARDDEAASRAISGRGSGAVSEAHHTANGSAGRALTEEFLLENGFC